MLIALHFQAQFPQINLTYFNLYFARSSFDWAYETHCVEVTLSGLFEISIS